MDSSYGIIEGAARSPAKASRAAEQAKAVETEPRTLPLAHCSPTVFGVLAV
jgi:hypothetical protein